MFDQQQEAKSKLEEICNLLVAAGYFRARVTSLSAFDRIIGGMCWGITASAVDIDVDVVFHENSSIGQKIKISDQVVKCLRRMRCPYPLMSHQIQGLDFPSLFPVCQWLVLKVIENRRATGDIVRAFSLSQFSKSLKLPEEVTREQNAETSMPFLNSVLKRYNPQRRYRRTTNQFRTPSAHVHSVLLEYGAQMKATVVEQDVSESKAAAKKRPQSVRLSIGDDGEISRGEGGQRVDGDIMALASKLGVSADSLDADVISALAADLSGGAGGVLEKDDSTLTEAERAAKLKAEQQLAALRGDLQETGGDDGVVKASSVGALVGLQSSEIRQAAEAAAAQMAGVSADPFLAQQQMFERHIAALQRQVKVQQEKADTVKQAHDLVSQDVSQTQAALETKRKYNERIVTETAKLKEMEKGKNQSDLTKLRELVSLNERLKQQESEFRENCKRQLTELRALMKEAESGVSAEEEEKMQQIEQMFEKDNGKFSKIRAAMAHKNQEIALLSRKIDDVPTRTELIQYEKSFVELYDQVSAKLEETRRYYDQYNTLESKKNFLVREVQLLDSIHDWFKVPPTNNKTKVMDALETYVKGTKETLDKAGSKLDSELKTRDTVSARYDKLVEEQRKFFKAVKDFQDECTKNEQLLARLQSA